MSILKFDRYKLSYSEININTKGSNVEILQALLSQLDFESFVDKEYGFDAYVLTQTFRDVEANLKALQEQFEFTYKQKQVEDKNWNEEWEKNFDPVLVENKCIIRADFHKPVENVRYEVIITPKMSFGTGHHATTYQMVDQLFDIELKNKKVLDMGCGTGVLAILAKKMGSGYTVGIDIDEWSVENSKENIQRNNTSSIEIRQGDAQILSNYEKFDVILANINRNILLNDMQKYASVLTKGGDILFSGFYTEDVSLMEEEAKKHNFILIDQNEKDNWSLLHFQLN